MMRRAALLVLVACGAPRTHSQPIVIAQETPPDAARPPDAPGPDATPVSEAPPPPPPAAPQTFPVPTTTPTITMISKGAKKHRAPLAFALTAGSAQTVDFTMTMTMSYLQQNVVMPAMILTMKSAVLSVASDGTAKLESTVVGATASDVPNEKMSAQTAAASYQKMIGTVWDETIAPDGSVRDMTVTIPVGAPQQLQQDQIAVTFPKDAIGVGARWIASLQTVYNGLQVQLSTTYKLVARKGKLATIDVDEAMTMPAQTYQQNGQTVNLQQGSATLQGRIVVDLGAPLPTGQFGMHEAITVLAMSQPLSMTVDIAMSMTAK